MNPVVIRLQKQRGQELQLHLLAVDVFQRRNAQQWIVPVRAAILPICGCEPKDLITLRGPMARRRLEVFALHVEHDGTALVGQKVRDDKARSLAASGRGHDQGMGEYLGHDKRFAALGLAHFSEDKAVARLAEETVSLHLRHVLPVGFTELGQRIVHQNRTE